MNIQFCGQRKNIIYLSIVCYGFCPLAQGLNEQITIKSANEKPAPTEKIIEKPKEQRENDSRQKIEAQSQSSTTPLPKDATIPSEIPSSKEKVQEQNIQTRATETNVEPSQISTQEQFKKPELNLSLETRILWTDALDSPLGKNLSSCIQTELRKNLPVVSGTQLARQEYINAYTKLVLYEHIKFKITTPQQELSQTEWGIKRNHAFLEGTDREYQELIMKYQQKKYILEEQLGMPLNQPPSLTTTGCQQMFLSVVNSYLKESAESSLNNPILSE